MEVELWERLEHHAPRQRRSVTNLMQWLVADGLDRLDEAEGQHELAENARELLRHVPPERIRDALEWQKNLLEQIRGGKPPHVLKPPPPPGMIRRRKRKP